MFFGFLMDTAAQVRNTGYIKSQEICKIFQGDWVISELIPKVNEVYDMDKQGYLYRMCAMWTAVGVSRSLSKD